MWSSGVFASAVGHSPHTAPHTLFWLVFSHGKRGEWIQGNFKSGWENDRRQVQGWGRSAHLLGAG